MAAKSSQCLSWRCGAQFPSLLELAWPGDLRWSRERGIVTVGPSERWLLWAFEPHNLSEPRRWAGRTPAHRVEEAHTHQQPQHRWPDRARLPWRSRPPLASRSGRRAPGGVFSTGRVADTGKGLDSKLWRFHSFKGNLINTHVI